MMLGVAVGIALATSLTVSPAKGFRDDGNDTQTLITLTGDVSDGAATPWNDPVAYWDAASDQHDPGHEMTINGSSIDSLGQFTVDTEVPLYDANGEPVRPGPHTIAVCATPVS
ncbi:MAG: hypothetical protein ACRENC_15820, partial [Gemmatimonadaceae bacterium]